MRTRSAPACRASWLVAMGIAVTTSLAACSPNPGEAGEVTGALATNATVDRMVAMDSALAAFQAEVGAAAATLAGGEPTPEALLGEIRRALAESDAAALARIALDRGEFAYLYYPSSPLSAAPYELPPTLAWFQLHQGSRTGAARLLRELGGGDPGPMELLCSSAPVEQEKVRILSGCRVRLASGAELRIFGALIEHQGSWKVLTFANDF